jgi:hypothetical protein
MSDPFPTFADSRQMNPKSSSRRKVSRKTGHGHDDAIMTALCCAIEACDALGTQGELTAFPPLRRSVFAIRRDF